MIVAIHQTGNTSNGLYWIGLEARAPGVWWRLMMTKTIEMPPIEGMGIRIDLYKPLTFSGNQKWGADIQRRVLTKSGNEGKPTRILLLTMDQSEGNPADLLRTVADLLDQGTAEIHDDEVDDA